MSGAKTLTEHTPTDRRELGYTRRVCAVDGINWPCPDVAQAREALAAEALAADRRGT